MCALAEYCLRRGDIVSGSDLAESDALLRLSSLGAEVYTGSRTDIIAGADLVVRSSAVPLSDAEVSVALGAGIPVVERHEFLAEIAGMFATVAAVAGTHGKTTVTAMTAHILKECGVPFVAYIGGEPVGMSNLVLSREKDGSLPRGIFLTEACEFERHLLALAPDIAVVLNMECDHPDSFGDIGEVRETFAKFVEKSRLAVLSCEDAHICKGARVCIREREGDECSRMPVCAYEYSRTPLGGGRQRMLLSRDGREESFVLPFAGAHIARDGAFAVALAVALGVGFEEACAALSSFRGVKRRAERAGRICGAQAVFDYAHHPTELGCALSAEEEDGQRVLVVFQPHTYSRTRSYLGDFAAVLGRRKEVVLMPVYAARGGDPRGGTSRDLADAIAHKYPECKVYIVDSHDEALDVATTLAGDYDKVLFLGAGDIYKLKERIKETDRDGEGRAEEE